MPLARPGVATATAGEQMLTARIPILEHCQPVAGQRVLDLGCGEGYCARALGMKAYQYGDALSLTEELVREGLL